MRSSLMRSSTCRPRPRWWSDLKTPRPSMCVGSGRGTRTSVEPVRPFAPCPHRRRRRSASDPDRRLGPAHRPGSDSAGGSFAEREALLQAVATAIQHRMATRMRTPMRRRGSTELLRAVGIGYIKFALDEPGWFEVAFFGVGRCVTPVAVTLTRSLRDRATGTRRLCRLWRKFSQSAVITCTLDGMRYNRSMVVTLAVPPTSQMVCNPASPAHIHLELFYGYTAAPAAERHRVSTTRSIWCPATRFWKARCSAAAMCRTPAWAAPAAPARRNSSKARWTWTTTSRWARPSSTAVTS